MTKLKTTPKEKMIVNLMEEVISILSTCEDLSDPEFSMYETMKYRSDLYDTDTFDSMEDKVLDAVNNLTIEDF